MVRAAVVILTMALLPSPVAAKARFQPYEGKDAVLEGKGGTKLTEHGIDYWTSGSPPRRYQVLGLLTDRRGTGGFSGDAVGSKSVAKACLKQGCDGVIMLGSSTQQTGMFTPSGSQFGIAVGKRYTRMIVIKYLN